MTPETYNQLMAQAEALKVQLDAAQEADKPALRTQLANNILVVRLTLVHEHLEVCPAPHPMCGWNNVAHPFDARDDDSWTPANKVQWLAEMKTKIESGEVSPAIPAPAPASDPLPRALRGGTT